MNSLILSLKLKLIRSFLAHYYAHLFRVIFKQSASIITAAPYVRRCLPNDHGLKKLSLNTASKISLLALPYCNVSAAVGERAFTAEPPPPCRGGCAEGAL